MGSRQIALSKYTDSGEPASLGSIRVITEMLAPFNTAPDTDDPSGESGTVFFHGPGLVIQVPTFSDQIMQAMVTLTDEEFAWPVLMQIRRATGWTFLDMESGQKM
ncbi:MAG: hypothetical protein H6815_03920 [Phycisphaeraceae bacterium]|nr:hypothetical protein [Phycisphaerales bacterium]MCB9859577.1 hypothetical protein [Phycisphaeraceae bacterium]